MARRPGLLLFFLVFLLLLALTDSERPPVLTPTQEIIFSFLPFHRNINTRMRMFELLLQTFRAKKPKSLLISTLDKVIYYVGTFLQGSTKPPFTSQNGVETG
jgi:hypothetical protein